MRIRIRSDVPLSAEGRQALADHAYGSAWFDLDGGFRTDGDASRRQAVELVLTDRLPDGVAARPTGVLRAGPDEIPEGTFLLLRDDRGQLHDYRACAQYVKTRHVMGALFQDEAGTVWAARRLADEAGSGEVAADWPLEQVSAHTHPTVEAGFGAILDRLPAMGEFQLTRETPSRVAWIPWWTGFGSDPEEGVVSEREDAVLGALLERVREMRVAGLAHRDPPPDAGPKITAVDPAGGEREVLVTLQDWRPAEEVSPDEPGKLDLRLTLRANQLLIDAPDGRQLMIELEGDQLKAHAYNDVSDAPATLRVGNGSPVEADLSDHLSELYDAEEGPAP